MSYIRPRVVSLKRPRRRSKRPYTKFTLSLRVCTRRYVVTPQTGVGLGPLSNSLDLHLFLRHSRRPFLTPYLRGVVELAFVVKTPVLTDRGGSVLSIGNLHLNGRYGDEDTEKRGERKVQEGNFIRPLIEITSSLSLDKTPNLPLSTNNVHPRNLGILKRLKISTFFISFPLNMCGISKYIQSYFPVKIRVSPKIFI